LLEDMFRRLRSDLRAGSETTMIATVICIMDQM
jgi:hypothetical protein